jgi:DNA-binding MarR family transcriptional regulator
VNYKTLLEELDDAQFEFLQCVAAFGSGRRPSMSEIAREYGYTRQWAWKHVKRLREKGLLEENEKGRPVWGVALTHNAKVLLERALGAELKH